MKILLMKKANHQPIYWNGEFLTTGKKVKKNLNHLKIIIIIIKIIIIIIIMKLSHNNNNNNI